MPRYNVYIRKKYVRNNLKPREEFFNNRLAKYLNRKWLSGCKKILDIGTGYGVPAIGLKIIGKDVIGIDICEESRRFCSNYGIDVKIVDIERKKFPFKKNIFDAVTCFHVIEHIKNIDFFLNEMKRVLKKDGLLIIATPNFRYAYRTFYSDLTHIKPYDHESIFSLLTAFGFEIVSIKKKFFPPLIWRLSDRLFDFPIFPSFILEKQSANMLIVAKKG